MYKNLVISGGGLHIIAMFGAVARIQERIDIQKEIVNYIGSSAGALLCFLLCSGLSFFRIKQILYDGCVRLSMISKEVSVLDALTNIYDKWGLYDNKHIKSLIEKVLTEKFHVDDMTFLEFAKASGKNLIVCVSNITECKHEYWNLETCPNRSIKDALLTSSAIPIIFPPFKFEDRYFYDGSIFNHFPIDYFKDQKQTLGILVNIFSEKTPPDNFFTFIISFVKSLIKKNQPTFDSENVVVIDPILDAFHYSFSLSEEDFETLYQSSFLEKKSAKN